MFISNKELSASFQLTPTAIPGWSASNAYTLNQYSWEIPEGGAPAHESALSTAMRELREETGIIATRWTKLLDLHTSNSVTDESAVGYIAQDLDFTDTEPDPSEVLAIRKLPLLEAIDMAMSGEITDALAMACFDEEPVCCWQVASCSFEHSVVTGRCSGRMDNIAGSAIHAAGMDL